MGMSGLLVVQMSIRDEWKCALMSSGGQFVMMDGGVQMLVWSVLSLDFHLQVKKTHIFTHTHTHAHLPSLNLEL